MKSLVEMISIGTLQPGCKMLMFSKRKNDIVWIQHVMQINVVFFLYIYIYGGGTAEKTDFFMMYKHVDMFPGVETHGFELLSLTSCVLT